MQPTEFQIKCAEECNGGAWPDLSTIVFKAPNDLRDITEVVPVVTLETRSCIRCAKPVEGDRCPACRAHQGTYAGAL